MIKTNRKAVGIYIKETALHMGIEKKTILAKSKLKGNFYGGEAYNSLFNRNIIKLSSPVIERWSEDSKIPIFLVTHELIHHKHDDNRVLIVEKIRLSKTEKIAVKFLIEMRANLEALSYLYSNDCSKNSYEVFLRELHNYNQTYDEANNIFNFNYDCSLNLINVKHIFVQNYPSYKMVANYFDIYHGFNEESKIAALNTFYDVMADGIDIDKELFIKTVLEFFANHHENF